MNKLITIVLAACAALGVATGTGLVAPWGYVVSGGFGLMALLTLFFRKPKVKVVKTPQSVVPVEEERLTNRRDKLAKIEAQIEDRDDQSSDKLKQREEKLEKDLKSPPSIIDIRAKLDSLRSGSDRD